MRRFAHACERLAGRRGRRAPWRGIATIDGARMAQWRHALHRQPELAFEEVKTSQFIFDTLASFGGDMDIARGLGGTGLVASLRGHVGVVPLQGEVESLPRAAR